MSFRPVSFLCFFFFGVNSDVLYRFITFKASDIGDLKIDDGNSKPEPPPAPPVPDDPAILSVGLHLCVISNEAC